MKSAVDTLHFWDGIRRIDMVLAYRDPEAAESDMAGDEESVGTQDEEENTNDKEERRAHEREVFEKNLRDVGLELELEPSQVSTTPII